MALFKAFWKVVKKNKVTVSIYIVISLAISVILLVTGQSAELSAENSLKNVTVGIVYENGSGFGDNLRDYIKKSFDTTGVSDMSSSGDDIKEALYSGATSYIVVIDGEKISDYQAPNNTSAYIAQNAINNYILTFRAMEKLHPNSSLTEIAKLTDDNLKLAVKIDNLGISRSDTDNLVNFFNIFVYGVLGAIVYGIGVSMMAMNERKLYMRTLVSPISVRRRNTALFSAQFCFGAITWLLGVLLSIYFAGDALFSPVHIMLIVNSIPFVISVTAIGFVIGQTVKNEMVFSGVTTVLMLCISFLSGVFIPQAYLASSVLKVSAMTPAYWYILNNNRIKDMLGYDWGALVTPIVIMIGFTVVLILAGAFITVFKMRKKIA